MIKSKSKRIILNILVIAFTFLCANIFAMAAPLNETVEGEGTHFVTGESYPSEIVFVGYDVMADKYYLNYKLTTEKATLTDIAYFIQIFDNNGATLINDTTETGTYTLPLDKTTGSLAGTTLTVTNKPITLNGALTAQYSLNISVKSVTE